MKIKKHVPHTTAAKRAATENIPLLEGTISEIFGRGKWKNLFAPVDISSIVFFRILFGTILFYEVLRYFSHGWIAKYWLIPKYHLTYWPFNFLSPLPGNGMYALFYLMGILAICIAAGLFYRIAAALFFICFSYVFLLEQSRYLNHFYLVMLISFVMIFVPANTSNSLDSRFFKKIKSQTAPAWSLWLLRFMVGVPYFFGGIAKINSDWLQGHPLNNWLLDDLDFPVIGPLFQYHWMTLIMSYTGMLLDLLIVPALLFKKTRRYAFPFIALFHMMNSQLFEIGIFPWFMIAATSLYFNPSWFRTYINYITGNSWPLTPPKEKIPEVLNGKQKFILAALCFWVGLQVILPLRHFFIPGNVHWTEEGHRYSWHMKLRSKRGVGIYTIIDKKTGQRQEVDPLDYLTKQQLKDANCKPYLTWQLCRIIHEDYQKKGMDVAVYADVKATLNGRRYQQLIDPTVDLASALRPFFPVKWIVPLTTSLSDSLEKENNDSEND